MSLLDHPVWNSLVGGWAALTQGDARARRLDPRYGPFGAMADGGAECQAALAGLIAPRDELWLVGTDALSVPSAVGVVRTAMLAQMVAQEVKGGGAEPDWAVLGEADAAEMLELALLTKPGPFQPLTYRLGRFIGVREGGKLIAMAGERMRMPGFAEVSGVCTHPDWRGRGLAGALMRIVARAMLDRGEAPFLHAYAAHEATIALYRTIGFELRAELPMMVVTRAINA